MGEEGVLEDRGAAQLERFSRELELESMISRPAASAIGTAYQAFFSDRSPVTAGRRVMGFKGTRIAGDSLYSYLFDRDFDAWVCTAMRRLEHDLRPHLAIVRFVQRLHTGESVPDDEAATLAKDRASIGQDVLLRLATHFVWVANAVVDEANSNGLLELAGKIKAQMELCGYVWVKDRFVQGEDAAIDQHEERGLIETLAAEAGLIDSDVIRHHLDKAQQHYADAKWDDSISNARKVLEAVAAQVAQRHHDVTHNGPLDPEVARRAVRVREYLRAAELVSQAEQEMLWKVYGAISQTGGHPYIADRDEARVSLHLAMTVSQLLLVRLRRYLNHTPAPPD